MILLYFYIVLFQLSEIDFQDSVKALGFADDLQTELLGHYVKNRTEIRRLQMEMSASLPHYHDLEWRLDVQVIIVTQHLMLQHCVAHLV